LTLLGAVALLVRPAFGPAVKASSLNPNPKDQWNAKKFTSPKGKVGWGGCKP